VLLLFNRRAIIPSRKPGRVIRLYCRAASLFFISALAYRYRLFPATNHRLPERCVNHGLYTTGYSTSVSNFARISFATDNVFSDGYSLQMATVQQRTK
jgi:hypothetical protein